MAIEAARDLPRLAILPPVLLSGAFLIVRVRNDGATMAGPVFVALLDEQGRQPDVTRRALHLAPGVTEKAHLTRGGGTWVVRILLHAGGADWPAGRPLAPRIRTRSPH